MNSTTRPIDTMANDENRLSAVYLYFYTDSVAFPRRKSQSLDQTWPFLLAEKIRSELGVPVFPCLRGIGGGTISEIKRLLTRDTGYFAGQDSSTRSFAIFNVGVVDSSPQPFTYCLRRIATIPFIGPRIWSRLRLFLAPHRVLLQKIYSYRRTSPTRFAKQFSRMVRQVIQAEMLAISVDTPLTPLFLEQRNPGLRDSIALYNAIKNNCYEALHISTDWVRDEYMIEDGHHFGIEGHRLMAECLMTALRPHLKS